MAINQRDDYMRVADNGIQVEPGFHTTLAITPTKINSTVNFQSLPLNKRQCKYRNEQNHTSSLFKYYTKSSCEFECRLKQSRTSCGCIPWNYPHILGENGKTFPLCDGPKAFCFEKVMSREFNLSKCECWCVIFFIS